MNNQKLLMDSKWLKVFLAVFIVQILLYYVIVSLPISDSEASSLSSSYNMLNQSIQQQDSVFSKAMYLYSHNLLIAFVELVPFLGLPFFGISTYLTSRTLEAVAIIQPSSVGNLPPQLVVSLLLLSPHSWLELPAYALAVTEGIFLIYAIVRRTLRSEYRRLVIVAILISLQLFVAATVEAIELQYPILAFYLWLPSILYFYMLYRLLSRVNIKQG